MIISLIEYTTKFGPSMPTNILNSALPHKRLRIDTSRDFMSNRPIVTNLQPGFGGGYQSQVVREDESYLAFQGPTVIRVEVWNRKQTPIRLYLSFSQAGEANYYRPFTEAISEIPALTTRDVLFLQKVNPENDWGVLECTFRLEDPLTFEDDSAAYNDFQNNNSRPIGGDIGAEISCPVCTLLNSSLALSCDACGTPLT